jgi:hypothetical protein
VEFLGIATKNFLVVFMEVKFLGVAVAVEFKFSN